MPKIKFSIAALAVLLMIFAIYVSLSSENSLVSQPKGIIAEKEWNLIKTNVVLMLVVLLPTAIVLLVVMWKFRKDNIHAKYDTDLKSYTFFKDFIFWIIPSVIVVIMAIITWEATHELNPYKPLESKTEPLTIQVVAMDWKWLFIYPEQKIATVNYVQFPEQVPIHFRLAGDGSPMNSFWIPQLSGQIYCMTGMVTSLHVMANAVGEFRGKAAEINGRGYARMNFVAKSNTKSEFENWVQQIKKSAIPLSHEVYNKLVKPSENEPITYYSNVEKDLFHKIVMKYMTPSGTKL